MKEISNRHYKLLVEKLPRVLRLALQGGGAKTIRQYEDIRQLALLYRRLKRQYVKTTKNEEA